MSITAPEVNIRQQGLYRWVLCSCGWSSRVFRRGSGVCRRSVGSVFCVGWESVKQLQKRGSSGQSVTSLEDPSEDIIHTWVRLWALSFDSKKWTNSVEQFSMRLRSCHHIHCDVSYLKKKTKLLHEKPKPKDGLTIWLCNDISQNNLVP